MAKIIAQGQKTITEINESFSVNLTNEVVAIPCYDSGVPKDNAFSGASTTIEVFQGNVKLGVSNISIGNLINSNGTTSTKSSNTVRITAVTQDNGYVDMPVSVVRTGQPTILLGTYRFTYVKQRDGISYTVVLTNEAHVIACQSNGTPLSGEIGPSGKALSHVVVYKGSVKLTAVAESATPGNNQFKYTFDNSVTLGCAAGRTDNDTFYINTVAADSGRVGVNINIENKQTIAKTMSFSKSKKGDTGETGKPGADGKPGTPGPAGPVLDWVQDWDGTKVTIGDTKVLAPKIFAGTVASGKPTGVALGKNVFGNLNGFTGVNGIAGYKNGVKTYHLTTDGNFLVGQENGNHMKFDGSKFTVQADSIAIGANKVVTTKETNPISDKANQAHDIASGANSKIDGLEVGGRNYIKKGRGGVKDGFFKHFNKVEYGYGEHTLVSQNIYSNIDIGPGFVLGCRDYEVGKKVTISYDFMYTEWNLPGGADITELWMGQRYTEASSTSSDGMWRPVTQNSLPIVGHGGCALNKWMRVVQTLTIPTQAHSSIGEQAQVLFYNNNPNVSARITFRIKNVKIEYGNKATDWTQAPEDTQAEIYKNTQEIEKTNSKVSSVEVDTKGIKSRVEKVETKQTTTDGKVTALETWKKAAEVQITEEAITNTVSKKFYTKDNIDSKGYQTSSQLQQKVDEFQFKLEESGGYNLLRNSAFKDGTSHWSLLNWGHISGSISLDVRAVGDEWTLDNRNSLCANSLNPTDTSVALGVGFDSHAIPGRHGEQFTFTGLIASHRAVGVSVEVVEMDSGGNRLYTHWTGVPPISGGNSRANWHKTKLVFTLQNPAAASFLIRVFMDKWNGEMNSAFVWLAEPMVVRGDKELPYTPNADEVYTGITSIDKDGIKVKMENGQGPQGYSKIDYEGLSIYNANGHRKAYFGDDDSAFVETITTNKVNNRQVIKWNEGRPMNFQVAPVATGDGTGRDHGNKSNSVNHTLNWIRETYGCYSWRQNLNIYVEDGTYHENIYIAGWLGSGELNLTFGAYATLYGNITVEECSMWVNLSGSREGLDYNHGCIIERRDGAPGGDAVHFRNSAGSVHRFRSRATNYYGYHFVCSSRGSRVMVHLNDVVGYDGLARAENSSFLAISDNRGDCHVLSNHSSSSALTIAGAVPERSSGINLANVWNCSMYEHATYVVNSLWIPKHTAPPPPPPPAWGWFENSFTLSGLRTTTEGSGSTTSGKNGQWGQGKWGSYKSHRGYANLGDGPSNWCRGGRNFTVWLTMTRQNTSHGIAGATPQPKIKEPNGNFWNSGVGFARGNTKTIQLPGSIAWDISQGHMKTLEMWAGTSTDNYSFYENASIKIKCEKQI